MPFIKPAGERIDIRATYDTPDGKIEVVLSRDAKALGPGFHREGALIPLYHADFTARDEAGNVLWSDDGHCGGAVLMWFGGMQLEPPTEMGKVLKEHAMFSRKMADAGFCRRQFKRSRDRRVYDLYAMGWKTKDILEMENGTGDPITGEAARKAARRYARAHGLPDPTPRRKGK